MLNCLEIWYQLLCKAISKYEELLNVFSLNEFINRIFLRWPESALKIIMSEEYPKLQSDVKFDEYALITSSYVNLEAFNWVLDRFEGDLPIVCVFVLIITQKEQLLEALLRHPNLQFKESDLTQDFSERLAKFLTQTNEEIMTKYTYFIFEIKSLIDY